LFDQDVGQFWTFTLDELPVFVRVVGPCGRFVIAPYNESPLVSMLPLMIFRPVSVSAESLCACWTPACKLDSEAVPVGVGNVTRFVGAATGFCVEVTVFVLPPTADELVPEPENELVVAPPPKPKYNVPVFVSCRKLSPPLGLTKSFMVIET